MAQSNAQRQAAYRQRAAEALRNAATQNCQGACDGKTLLVGTYFTAGRSMLERHGDAARAALDEFEALPEPTWLDLMEIMEEAGQDAAGRLFERRIFVSPVSKLARPLSAEPAPRKANRRVT